MFPGLPSFCLSKSATEQFKSGQSVWKGASTKKTRPPTWSDGLFVLIALAALTSCRDNPAAPVDVAPSIKVVCGPGAACIAMPDHLETWPKKIEVLSLETWKCEIVASSNHQACSTPMNLPAAAMASIELRADENPSHFVRVAVVDQEPTSRE